MVSLIKRLIILGIAVALPVGSISLMPFAHQLAHSWFDGGWAVLFSAAFRGVLVLLVTITIIAYLTLFERRVAGLIQLRYGPNRVGWFGFLQPVADGIKFFFKEDIIPENVHKPLFVIAPTIIFISALAVYAVIPFGPSPEPGVFNPYQVAPVNIGILLIFALSGLGVYSLALGGWSSFSKWSLLGGLRASAQMISYELALGLSVVGVLIYSGSFDLSEIVHAQTGTFFGFLPAWNILPQFLGFVVFLVAMFAETNRLPFDMPEAEQELVGGYHTEYSSMKFALLMLAEYGNMITAAALVTLLFLGGWDVPGLGALGLPELAANAVRIFAFFFKMAFFLFLFLWARWTLPRFRYDQVMRMGWRYLFPIAIANVILTAILVAIS